MKSLQRIWNPIQFHGGNRKGPFFEGWYYKLVSPDRKSVLAVIPAVHYGGERDDRYAFIQVLDSRDHHPTFHSYPMDDFHYRHAPFEIRIGPNRFSQSEVELNIDSPKRPLAGMVSLDRLVPWPVTLTSPGCMGWYAFVPFMQCYHGVPGFDHSLSGKLTMDNREIDFTGGRGYLEKDWGTAFPRAYVWIQSNHFATEKTSLMVSIATIPWMGSWFAGFLIGFLHEGKLHRFTSYNGAKLEKNRISPEKIEICITRKEYRLEILAERSPGGLLWGPGPEGFTQHVEESLTSGVHVRLHKKDKLLFEGWGDPAALDVDGSIDEIFVNG